MFCCGEHVSQPPDGADVPVGLEGACGRVGWRVPEVQDGLHSIHVLLSQHTVEQIISNAVVEDLAVQSSSLSRGRRLVGLSIASMEFPFQLLLGWSGLEGTPTPGDDQDLNSFTAAFHAAHRPRFRHPVA